MVRVVSFGSVNADRVRNLSDERLDELRRRYEWFPEAGETVTVESVPAELRDLAYDDYVGGKGANQAVAAARAGADADLCGAVGPDASEYGVVSTLRERGVGVGHVARSDRQTGKAYVFVAEDGESHIALLDGANGAMSEADARRHRNHVLAADCLLVQNELPVSATEALLAELDAADDRPTVVLDPAPADGAEPLVAHDAVDVVTPNEVEYAALSDALSASDATVVRTRGPDDVLVDADERFAVSPPSVEQADATGAGDTFAGYLAVELASGSSLREAVTVAATAAALSTESPGAQPSIPDRATVEAALD